MATLNDDSTNKGSIPTHDTRVVDKPPVQTTKPSSSVSPTPKSNASIIKK